MRRARSILISSVTACLLLQTATAEDVPFSSHPYDGNSYDDNHPVSHEAADSRIDLEARIASLESQIEWLKRGRPIDVLGMLERQQACRDRNSGGLYAGAEVTFLRTYLGGARPLSANIDFNWIDSSYGSGIRYILGYRNDNGLGLRARYFTLNHSVNSTDGGTIGINMDAVDAEITFRGRLRNWVTEVSGGVRYGRAGLVGRLDPMPVLPQQLQGRLSLHGVGPTVAFDARKNLGNSGFTLFGNIRGSLLLGEVHNNQPVLTLPRGTIEGQIAQIIDNQLGVAWTRCCNNGSILEIRAAWETQFWLNDTLADDVYGIGTNLALSGPAVAVELKY